MDLLANFGRGAAIQIANQAKFLIRRLASIVTYDEVKDVPNHPEIYLIDVRRRDELEETGCIPSSINIPLEELEAALQMDSDNFQSKYYRPKPDEDTKIIFSCRGGNRILEAEKIAKSLGFSNLSLYKGSWLDWAENEGLE